MFPNMGRELRRENTLFLKPLESIPWPGLVEEEQTAGRFPALWLDPRVGSADELTASRRSSVCKLISVFNAGGAVRVWRDIAWG